MARPREPWKRQRLLDIAEATLAEKGVGSVTVKDVAAAAGVSPGTIHYHFTDIDGVLLGVVERALEQMYDERLALISAIPDIREKLFTLIDLGIPDDVSLEVTLMYEAISTMRSEPQFRVVLRSFVERQVSLYRSVIDAGIAAGTFTAHQSADAIARNLLALEDAYDMYLVLGIQEDGSRGRRATREYAARALGIDATDDEMRES